MCAMRDEAMDSVKSPKGNRIEPTHQGFLLMLCSVISLYALPSSTHIRLEAKQINSAADAM